MAGMEQMAAAVAELEAAAAAVDPQSFDAFLSELAAARRIVCHGLGREGLMMRALAMRLYHLGLDAHVAGEMSCPPVGPGDLFLFSAGPGAFGTLDALCAIVRHAGARSLCITAEPQGRTARAADSRLVIPAQTMASDCGAAATSVFPMGSLFEGAMFVVFEIAILALRDRLNADPAAMRARHTNLE